jgi:putative transposase
MKLNIEPLQPDSFYHIYNRGVGGENIFKQERNYLYFLKKYALYIEPVAETYAYCLLKNHFHLLIRTRSEEEILKAKVIQKESFGLGISLSEDLPKELTKKGEEKPSSWHLSNSFASLFKSYAQAINVAHKRTGRLFEEPFRRILVDNDAYFTELIYYIHHNAQKHGFVKDFRDYPHSSYHSHLHTALTKLKRDEVLQWFGNRNEFEKYHLGNQILTNLDKFNIEFD